MIFLYFEPMTCMFFYTYYLQQKLFLLIVLCAFYCLFIQVCEKGPLDLLQKAGAESLREENKAGGRLIITKLQSLSPSLLFPFLLLLLLLHSLWKCIPHLHFSVCQKQTASFSISTKFLPAAFWIKFTFSHGSCQNISSLPLHIKFSQ